MSVDTITHVVVPGTFDPVTLGHIDVIRRTRRLFPKVTVAVAASVNKHGRGTAFTLDERVEMIREALVLEGLPDDIEVLPFTGLLVEFCEKIGAGGVVKGLRAMTDFEYELQQADLMAEEEGRGERGGACAPCRQAGCGQRRQDRAGRVERHRMEGRQRGRLAHGMQVVRPGGLPERFGGMVGGAVWMPNARSWRRASKDGRGYVWIRSTAIGGMSSG